MTYTLKWKKNKNKNDTIAKGCGFKYIIALPYVDAEMHHLYLQWGENEQTISIATYEDIKHCKDRAQSHHDAVSKAIDEAIKLIIKAVKKPSLSKPRKN